MNFTSPSENSPNTEVVLKVDNLSLLFRLQLHPLWSWRDAFTRAVSRPLDMLGREKDYLVVARDISFEVKEGERVGIIGVNGAGKTSLCRCIAGMYRPNKGKVVTQGSVRAIFNAQIGVLPDLTGRENAKMLSHLLFPEEKNTDELVEEALDFSELGKFLDVPYRQYSNGMQARLGLSLISAVPSRLLILDEVFDGADTFFQKKMSDRIMNLIKKSGAVIFISHSEEQILKVCTRVLVLDKAQVVFDGPPKEGLEFYTKLKTPHVGNA